MTWIDCSHTINTNSRATWATSRPCSAAAARAAKAGGVRHSTSGLAARAEWERRCGYRGQRGLSEWKKGEWEVKCDKRKQGQWKIWVRSWFKYSPKGAGQVGNTKQERQTWSVCAGRKACLKGTKMEGKLGVCTGKLGICTGQLECT